MKLKESVSSTSNAQPCLAPSTQSKWHNGQRRENVLGEMQPSKRCYEMAFVFRRATRLCEQKSPLGRLGVMTTQAS